MHVTKDTENRARIHGVHAQMKTFAFLFGTDLGETVLRHTDNLSKTVQSYSLQLKDNRLPTWLFTLLRPSEMMHPLMLSGSRSQHVQSLDIADPQLPHRRKTPRRFEDGFAEGSFHTDPKAYCRQHYFEAIDLVVNCIRERFDQPRYRVYRNLEQLLLKAAEKEDVTAEFDDVCSFYKDDFHPENLRAQLLTFGVEYGRNQSDNDRSTKPIIFDIKNYFTPLAMPQRSLLSEVYKVVKLVLVMPATNATSERSFSALRRVKNYLRRTMTQQRLDSSYMYTKT